MQSNYKMTSATALAGKKCLRKVKKLSTNVDNRQQQCQASYKGSHRYTPSTSSSSSSSLDNFYTGGALGRTAEEHTHNNQRNHNQQQQQQRGSYGPGHVSGGGGGGGQQQDHQMMMPVGRDSCAIYSPLSSAYENDLLKYSDESSMACQDLVSPPPSIYHYQRADSLETKVSPGDSDVVVSAGFAENYFDYQELELSKTIGCGHLRRACTNNLGTNSFEAKTELLSEHEDSIDLSIFDNDFNNNNNNGNNINLSQ